MCGIAGVMFFDGRKTAEAEQCAHRMLETLRHRGPDGHGVSVDTLPGGPVVALAHTRLAIIDLSAAGAQPMSGPNATRLTFNGEIYNYRELRQTLSAQATFRSGSDTEVLLAAYAAWGDAAWARLEGMFGFALWDPSAGALRLVRDRLGIKPVYYAATPEALVFASEVRTLLASGLVARRIDGASLWHYLGYQTAATPATLIDGVSMLEPGHALTISADGRQSAKRYWHVLDAETPQAHTRDEALEEVRARLHAAVTSHMVSDVPVGVFLSGGIDSGSLVSALSSAGVTPRTFSVVFDDPQYDESATVREVARQFGAEHTEIALSGDAMFDMLPDVLASVDHPSGDGVNSYVVSTLVRQHGLKVALSGLGGDEVFGGYASFRRMSKMTPLLRTWGKSPAPVRQAAASLVRTLRTHTSSDKAAALLETDGDPSRTWPVTRQVFSLDQRRALLPHAPASLTESDAYETMLARAFAMRPDADLWTQVWYAELRTYMHDVLLRDTDQMSMAHALEVRVPLLDHRLVEYVVHLPEALKQSGHPKALLADSLRQPLPASVTHQPKRGFVLPFDTWMRGRLRAFCEEHLAALDARGLFASGEVSRVWTRFFERRVTWSRAWTLVALESWMRRERIEDVAW